jgi:hypothetical protein
MSIRLWILELHDKEKKIIFSRHFEEQKAVPRRLKSCPLVLEVFSVKKFCFVWHQKPSLRFFEI